MKIKYNDRNKEKMNQIVENKYIIEWKKVNKRYEWKEAIEINVLNN